MLFAMKVPHGVTQIVATVVAAIVTITLIPLGARFVWMPVLMKKGLWWATLLLACAILAWFLATLVGSAARLLDPNSFLWSLATRCAIAGLLYSWGLAAIRCAQEKKAYQA